MCISGKQNKKLAQINRAFSEALTFDSPVAEATFRLPADPGLPLLFGFHELEQHRLCRWRERPSRRIMGARDLKLPAYGFITSSECIIDRRRWAIIRMSGLTSRV